MQIFKNGFLCLPFISLPYIDVLSDKSHNGFIAGASNVLFQQKRTLVDVMVDVPSQTIDFVDPEMKRCLTLTTEDLRFFEHILKGIENPKADGTGMDSWIRDQFQSYFISMLRTIYDTDNHRDLECFNEHFMEMWRKTNNYQDWLAKKITHTTNDPEATVFECFPKGHPFMRPNNVINVSDFKNKIVQLSVILSRQGNDSSLLSFSVIYRSINNTQSGRKLNQAVNNTFSSAKAWLSNFTAKDENVINLEEREKTNEGV